MKPNVAIPYIEPDQAHPVARQFYERAESQFDMLPNLFKLFGHVPDIGAAYTDVMMNILKDGELDWATKELMILKASHRNECRYCVTQHERISKNLGISDEKIADIGGARYKNSPHFTEAEKGLLDLTVYIGINAHHIPDDLWETLRKHFTDAQIVEAAFTIVTYIAMSKFGSALGIGLEDALADTDPILQISPSP